MHQHAKKSWYFIDSIWRNSWFKELAIWLTESILGHSSGARFFLVQDLYRNTAKKIIHHFVQNFFKFKRPYLWSTFGPFPQFLKQKTFFQKLQLCHAKLRIGSLSPCQNSKKSNNQIPRKHLDRWQDGWTGRPYFIASFWLLLGV